MTTLHNTPGYTCLNNMVESWYSAMNDGNIIGSLELDFSKAFDILDINILLRKLELYGCDPTSLRWFRSNLKDILPITKL